MAETLFIAILMGAFLLSIALFISASVKKNARISTAIIIMGTALFIMLSEN
ncbi:MAG: hypothetical protein Q8R53_02235 [Nanoarchaeota archaeon]|nr:hypothetical protein [Nanoarchaeota archaeon]